MLSQINDRIRQVFPDNSLPWLRALVILALLLIGPFLAFQNSSLLLIGTAGLVIAVPITLLLLRKPELGVLGIVLVGLVVPFIFQGGLNANVFLISYLMVLWIVDMFILQPEFRLIRSRILLPVYMLIVASIVAFVMGQYPWFRFVPPAPLDAQAGGFAVYLLSFGALLLAAYQIKNLKTLERITWVFVFMGSFYAFTVALPGIRTVVQAVFGTSGSVFWIWLVAITYSQALFNRDLKLPQRSILMAVVAVSLVILFYLKFDDKSGWVPIIIVGWVITMMWNWKLGALMTAVGIAGMLIILPDILDTESYSLATRLELLPILWQIILANPLFGVGFANYYSYTTLFSIRGWSVSLNSHNNYVDIVAQTGLFGMVAFAWFILATVITSFQLRNRVPDGFAKAYVYGAIGAFAGMLSTAMLGDWILPFVYNIGLRGFRISVIGWVFLGGLVVLEKLYHSTDGAPL